jgi:hypothetical protein
MIVGAEALRSPYSARFVTTAGRTTRSVTRTTRTTQTSGRRLAAARPGAFAGERGRCCRLRAPAAMRLLRLAKVKGRRHTHRSVLMRATRRVPTRRRALVAVYYFTFTIMVLRVITRPRTRRIPPIMVLRVITRPRTRRIPPITVLRVITRPRTRRIPRHRRTLPRPRPRPTRPSTILSYSQIQAPLRRYTTTIQVARSLRQRCSRTDI